MNPPAQLTIGQRYKIHTLTGRQKKPREWVMDFMGTHNRGTAAEELVFDARPLAGTQRIPTSWVVVAEPVPRGTTKVIDRATR